MPHCALSSTGRYGGAVTRPLPGDAIGNGAPRIADLITKRNCSTKEVPGTRSTLSTRSTGAVQSQLCRVNKYGDKALDIAVPPIAAALFVNQVSGRDAFSAVSLGKDDGGEALSGLHPARLHSGLVARQRGASPVAATVQPAAIMRASPWTRSAIGNACPTC